MATTVWSTYGIAGEVSSYGSNEGTWDISVSPVNGNIFIAYDRGGTDYEGNLLHHLQKLNKDGEQLWKLHNADERTAWACVADVLPGDAVYVGYVYPWTAGNIAKLDANGAEIWMHTGSGSDCRCLAIDAEGNLYAGFATYSTYSTVVQKISPDGTVLNSTSLQGYMLVIKVGLDGNIYCAFDYDLSKSPFDVIKLSPDLQTVLMSIGRIGYCWAVDGDADGNTYAGYSENKVQKISPEGVVLWANTDSWDCWSIAADPAGGCYCGHMDGTVRKIDNYGTPTWSKNDSRWAVGLELYGGRLYVAYSNTGIYWTSAECISFYPDRGRNFADGFILGYQVGDQGNADTLEAITGVPGDKGPTGDMGPVGFDGPRGATGFDGPRGPYGLQGPQGLKGATGPAGTVQGLPGIQGIAGDKGETGTEPGIKGDIGPQGPQGPRQPNPTDIQLYEDGVIVTYADSSVESQSITKDGDERLLSVGVTIINYVVGSTP